MENLEQDSMVNAQPKSTLAEQVTHFYSGDFKTMFFTFFKDPISGIQTIFQNPSDKSYTHALILYASVAVLYLVGTFLLAGDVREYMNLSSYLKITLFPVLTMLAISVLSFAVKSLAGKINLKDELLTGALCGIPLGLMIPGLLVTKLLGTDNVLSLLMQPSGGSIFFILLFLYVFLMLVNVFQQSLKSAKANDTLAWYVSPLCIALSVYLASKVSENLF
jgi:hypothetical protein